MSGVKLSLWEVETIRYLSTTYLVALQDYEDENAIPPYISDIGEDRLRREYAAKRRAMLSNRVGTN